MPPSFRKALIQDATHTKDGDNLPEGWQWVKFKDIARVVSARRVHKRDWRTEGVPFYRALDIVQLSEHKELRDKLFNQLSKFSPPEENNIMITAVGTLGKTYLVKKEDRFYYKDASVLCLKLYDGISAQYVNYVLQSKFMRRQIFSNAHGTTVLTLPIRHMENYKLPLPPIDEQNKIVSKLDSIHNAIFSL